MKSLKVKVKDVPVSDLLRLEALLPTGEFKVWNVGENQYEIRVEKMVCATVKVVDGEFEFDFAQRGYPGLWADRLREGMLLLNPQLDHDRVLWIVVFPWCGDWSYSASPSKTKEAALQNISPITFGKPGAMLVGFKASGWPCQALKAVHSFEIVGTYVNYIVGTEDQGEMVFEFTLFEKFIKPW